MSKTFGLRIMMAGFAAALPMGGCEGNDLVIQDLGDTPLCVPLAATTQAVIDQETALLALVDEHRARGAHCGDSFLAPADAVERDRSLHCAARFHARDLLEQDRLRHSGSSGESVFQRADRAGYRGVLTYELLAAEFLDPDAVLQTWLMQPRYCRALLDPSMDEAGAGYARSQEGDEIRWVLMLGERSE